MSAIISEMMNCSQLGWKWGYGELVHSEQLVSRWHAREVSWIVARHLFAN